METKHAESRPRIRPFKGEKNARQLFLPFHVLNTRFSA